MAYVALLLDNFAFVINVIKSINSFNCDVSFSAVKQWEKREKNPTYSLKNNAFCSRITYLLPILVALFTNAMYCLQKKYFLNSVIHYKCFCVQSERTWCVNYSFLFIRKSRKNSCKTLCCCGDAPWSAISVQYSFGQNSRIRKRK